MSTHFSKEVMQLANKCLKNIVNIISPEKNANQNHTEKTLHTPWDGYNQNTVTSVGKDVEKPTYFAGGIMCVAVMENSLVVLQNVEHRVTTDSTTLFFGIYPRELSPQKNLCMNIQSSICTIAKSRNNSNVHQQVNG